MNRGCVLTQLDRVQKELIKRDYAAALLFDPINIRYATGSSNMQVWTLHNAARYAVVPAEGKVVLFRIHGCQHLPVGLETIGDLVGYPMVLLRCGTKVHGAVKLGPLKSPILLRR